MGGIAYVGNISLAVVFANSGGGLVGAAHALPCVAYLELQMPLTSLLRSYCGY